MIKTLMTITLTSFVLTACAASPSGGLRPSEPVRFTSAPTAATVTAEDGRSCMTPCTLRFGTAGPARFSVAMDGYQTLYSEIGTRFFKAGSVLDAASVASGDPIDMLATALFAARDKGNNRTLDTHSAHIILLSDEGTSQQ